jgi:hypothetical protein
MVVEFIAVLMVDERAVFLPGNERNGDKSMDFTVFLSVVFIERNYFVAVFVGKD